MSSQPSHAVLSIFEADPSRRDDQDFGLRNLIAPGVSVAPGFVSGIWTRSEDGRKSTVIVAFGDEASARDFRASVQANAENQAAVGLTLLESSIVVVSAYALSA